MKNEDRELSAYTVGSSAATFERESQKKLEIMEMANPIMFHHFHDQHHVPTQGSLDSEDFEEMLDWLAERFEIINAFEYLERVESGQLGNEHICLTFDDALLCQWDVAVPVLRKRNLQAFFFIYSSVFTGIPDYLEVFRYFRTTCFDNLEHFYDLFSEIVRSEDESTYQKACDKYKDLDYLVDFPFYTESDKWFRYLRDQVLGTQRYDQMMRGVMDRQGFDPMGVIDRLWMKEKHLKALCDEGHVIGLHSFNHPVRMSRLTREDQLSEYLQNLQHLESIAGRGSIVSMSHPCGDYNDDTLSLLRKLGIRIGFRSNLGIRGIKSKLEIPREDHANILRAMKSERNALYSVPSP